MSIQSKGPTFVSVISNMAITELRMCLEILDQAVFFFLGEIELTLGDLIFASEDILENGVAKVEADASKTQ